MRQRHDATTVLDRLHAGLAAFATALDAVTPAAAAPAEGQSAAVDWAGLQPRLEALRASLASADMISLRLFTELRDAIAAAVGTPLAKSLGRQIETMEFDAALACLDEITSNAASPGSGN